MDDKNFMLFTMTFLFVFTLVLASIRIDSEGEKINKLKKENTKLKENISQSKIRISELEQLNESYKWQLEQVPYIIEYGCKGE